MDSDDIRMFIDKLNLQLNMFSFDWMVPIPMPFSDLARANRVSDKTFRSLNLPEQIRGKLLKELLKRVTVETRCLKSIAKEEVGSGSKRKHCPSSCSIESASKSRRIDQNNCKVDDCQSCSSTYKDQDEGEKETDNEDKLDFKDEKVCNAIRHLNEFLENDNLEKLRTVLNKSRDEGELEIGLGIHLFTKLAGKAVINQKKSLRKCPCGCLEQVKKEEKMWIGSENTWYGEFDILTGNPVEGDSVSVSFDQETADDDLDMQETSRVEQFESDLSEEGDQGESPEDGQNIEVKYSRLRPGLNQLIAQAVVFAFTEYNRHKTKGKCIPSILIDKSGFQYVIYNPVVDILLVSNYMMFSSKDDFDPATGYRPFVVLWMILNYRIFFAKNPSFKKPSVKSGFHQQISDLEPFKMLTGYSKNISIMDDYYFPNDTPNTLSLEGLYWFLNRKSLV